MRNRVTNNNIAPSMLSTRFPVYLYKEIDNNERLNIAWISVCKCIIFIKATELFLTTRNQNDDEEDKEQHFFGFKS